MDKFPKTSNLSPSSPSHVSSSVVKTAEASNDSASSEVNLNDSLEASVSTTNQKQPSLWMIVFVVLLVGSGTLVFFLYRKRGQKEESTTTDEFELLD